MWMLNFELKVSTDAEESRFFEILALIYGPGLYAPRPYAPGLYCPAS